MARNFKRLEVWNLGYDLVLDFYKLIEKFPEYEKDNLISQIRRASTSIPLNIAEGCSRQSKKSFLQFFIYAYGSCKELTVLLMLSRDFKYISEEVYEDMDEKVDKLSRKLFVFIKEAGDSEFFQ
ncbi:MAG: four helix bundle protein [DPANN group archaeon]|nr:four helix bundle protein [DPANN group archaeon]MBS3156911.1 four helix bundle protein [Candidatus Woesearchaeota archaeon]